MHRLVYTQAVHPAVKTVLPIACVLACTWLASARAAARGTAGGSEVSPDSEPLIRVTAVVTDRRGQLLAGLKATDFDLMVDGKPQPVDSVELSRAAAAPRVFALLLDEFHTAPDDSAVVRDSLLRFVDQSIRPDDLAFVVKPLDSLTSIAPAMNREALRGAIASFAGRKGDYTPRTAFEKHYMAQAPTAVAHARGQIVTSALRAIAVTLSQTSHGRPAIVLVSDGFERMRASRDLPANLQSAVRIANRADAPVYAFAPAPEAAVEGDAQAVEPRITALRSLTAQTGGDLVIGATGIDQGLARMLRDLDSHYVLTYKAAHGSDGRFHALQLGIKRPGLQVRARAGYVAPLSADLRAALTPGPPAPPRVLRRSPLIQSWFGMLPIESGRAALTLTWEPTPPRPGAPPRAAAATILVTASIADGTILFDGAVAPAVEQGSPEVPNRATFDAPAGAVRVDVKVLDARGVVLDTDARDVTVPRLRGDTPTVFTPAVIRTRSAREFREAARAASAAAPIATRDFRRTDRLLIRVPAIDPAGAPATVTATLLNRWRHPMRDLPSLAADSPAGVTQFDLSLAPLAPGEYTVRFTVIHGGRPFSEHVTFRVQG